MGQGPARRNQQFVPELHSSAKHKYYFLNAQHNAHQRRIQSQTHQAFKYIVRCAQSHSTKLRILWWNPVEYAHNHTCTYPKTHNDLNIAQTRLPKSAFHISFESEPICEKRLFGPRHRGYYREQRVCVCVCLQRLCVLFSIDHPLEYSVCTIKRQRHSYSFSISTHI